MNISIIAQTVPASPIRKLARYASVAKKKGIRVYHLNIGNPDIKTPDVMMSVLTNWSKNPISYANSHGEGVFLDSLLGYYHNLGYATLEKNNIQITLGGSEGLLWSFLSIANPGEEIITFEPLYANYISFATMTHIVLVPILTTIDTGFHLPSKEVIQSKISPKTKAILICNPCNPTGTVYTEKELEMLVDIAKKNNLYIIADEAYREFIYDGKKTVSMLKYAKVYPKGIVIVDSLSKRYSLCGARLGALVSYNEALMDSFLRYAQARLSAGFVDQLMAAELAHIDKNYFSSVITEYEDRRNIIVNALSKINGVTCHKPEGAFYVIVKLPVNNAEDFAQWLLTDFSDNKETVMVAPAAGFYHSKGLGNDEIRLAYVLNKKDLNRAVEIIEKGLNEYSKIKKV